VRHTDERRRTPDGAGPLDDVSDAEVVKLVGNGDRTALAALFERYQGRVYRYVATLVGQNAMAEEIVNDVFLQVWQGARRFEGRSAASTWLFGITRNRALTALRKRAEAPLDEETAARVPDPGDSPARAAERDDVSRVVGRCMNRLSPEHREVIALTYYHEMSVHEIAKLAGVPENTVKTRMFHARKRLGEMLREAGIDGVAP
jgi:RNA polymerase sigma-70 factor (ECF subfamily)